MQSSGSVQSIGGRAILLSLCVSNQCDKIGQLLKSLGDIVSYKISPYRYWSTFLRYFKNLSCYLKTALATFWAINFGKWATFNSSILSHCVFSSSYSLSLLALLLLLQSPFVLIHLLRFSPAFHPKKLERWSWQIRNWRQ